MRNLFASLVLAGCLSIAGSATIAQSAGELEYMHSCSACHGATGHGDGSLTDLLTVVVPDLTKLSANNDGEFPMLDIVQIIDGRAGVRGHGDPMAVWGDRFNAQLDVPFEPREVELIVRGRILALAQYLESIQE